MEIVHISDFHFGSPDFREDCMLSMIDFVNEKRPDMVVCTGDLTHKGRQSQYQGILEYLNRIEVPFICVPGNHDARYSGLVFFERYIGARRSKVVLNDCDALILGLRSAKGDTSEGELTSEQLQWIMNELEGSDHSIKIIALHHHLLSVPSSGFKRTTLVDAGEMLELTRLYDVDLVLMGHKHCPHAWTVDSTVLLYCGTTTSEKVRADERPCFNYLHINDNHIEAYIVDSITYYEKLLINHRRGCPTNEFIRHRKTRIEHISTCNVWNSQIRPKHEI
ncbi:MAG: metallophosphoesterase family protein [Promethearchaeia archaeon]